MTELHATRNRFGGIYIHADGLPDSTNEFADALTHSLRKWEQDLLKVAWLQIPLERSTLIPVAVEAGFHFHHCSAHEIILLRRLQPDAFLFPYASHYVAAGAVVLTDDDQLLVVVERHRDPTRSTFYKLPGGMLDDGEHIADAAVREVREETGIETRFESLVCFRHMHNSSFGKSNIYFICRLTPLTTHITRDEVEIAEAFWMPVDEFLVHENVHAFNKKVVETALSHDTLKPTTIEGYAKDPRQFEIFLPA
jgi:8-oxo-dGTP pyrophosphatase MutT (NUDIX family)